MDYELKLLLLQILKSQYNTRSKRLKFIIAITKLGKNYILILIYFWVHQYDFCELYETKCWKWNGSKKEHYIYISLADDLSFENQMHCNKSMDQVVLLSVCNHSEPNLIRANTF